MIAPRAIDRHEKCLLTLSEAPPPKCPSEPTSMPNLATRSRSKKSNRVAAKTTRPAIVDLRFREDAWIVADECQARICLGDYHLCGLAVTSFDVPGLNNLYFAVRVGQARKQMAKRQQATMRRVG